MCNEFNNVLKQFMPKETPSVSKRRSRRAIASKKQQARQQNLLLELEVEIDKWLTNVSTLVAIEATKSFAPIVYSETEGYGLTPDNRDTSKEVALLDAAQSVASHAKRHILDQLFSHTRIPSLLAAQSRKYKTKVASERDRPAAQALYKKKIKELLKIDPHRDFDGIVRSLENDGWINPVDDDWTVATAEDDYGRPDGKYHCADIKGTTMKQVVSKIRGTVKKNRNH